MRTASRWALGVALVAVLAVSASADSKRKFVITDDCDASDPGWAATGGCLIQGGQVNTMEFGLANPGGHPAWRIDPPYVPKGRDKDIRVKNTGGRDHTFTEVGRFGGGYIPPLNPVGAFLAPECQRKADGTLSDAVINSFLKPGAELRVEDLEPGTHNFQCCIHPWMRTTVKVKDRHQGHDDRE